MFLEKNKIYSKLKFTIKLVILRHKVVYPFDQIEAKVYKKANSYFKKPASIFLDLVYNE
jgi:hypothetical protein